MKTLRQAVERLADVLDTHGEPGAGGLVRAAVAADEEGLKQFLTSNTLWGGAGSIADQAGLTPGRGDGTRAIEAALAELGEEQIRAGILNPRTESWVTAFRRWQREGL